MRSALCGVLCATVAAAVAAGCSGNVGEAESPESAPNANVGQCERLHPGVGPMRVGDSQGASVAIARAGDHTIAYVADEDGDQLQIFDVTDGRALGGTTLNGSPSQVMVMADGRVAVTIRDKNQLQVLEPTKDGLEPELVSRCALPTPAEPVGLAASDDDAMLVVSSAWAKKVSAYDSRTGRMKFVKDVHREPRTVVVDGDRAFVSHVVGGKVSVIDLVGKTDPREIDLRVKQAQNTGTTGELRSGCQGFALAKSVAVTPDDKPVIPQGEQPQVTPQELKTKPDHGTPTVPSGRIFAPRVTIDPGNASRQTTNYYDGGQRVEAPIVSVIDSEAERNLTVALQDMQRRPGFGQSNPGQCFLPRSAAVSATSGGLLVTCLGSDTVVELDPRGLDPARLERRRWKVPSGPLGIAVDDDKGKAVVWSQFDRMLSVIDLEAKNPGGAVDVLPAPRLAKSNISDKEAWGRKLFHQTDDPRIARSGAACASCHPDGREDALTWPTPNGPRQTIALAGRLKGAAPYSWLGEHNDLHAYISNTMTRLQGRGLHSYDNGKGSRVGPLDALVAYVENMKGPNLDTAWWSPEKAKLAARGKELFFDQAQGCASCHMGGGGTDAKQHDINTLAQGDAKPAFDTPALHLIGGTGPYFHDGRYQTLMDMLLATDSQMGHTMHLSREDALALEAYLQRL